MAPVERNYLVLVGGGFILYLTLNKKDKNKLIKRLSAFKIVNFSVDNQGSQIIYRS